MPKGNHNKQHKSPQQITKKLKHSGIQTNQTKNLHI